MTDTLVVLTLNTDLFGIEHTTLWYRVYPHAADRMLGGTDVQ